MTALLSLIPFITLFSFTTSLHVFVSSQTPHLITKKTFSLVMEGDDCPYNPCFYSVQISDVLHSSGEYENSTQSVDIIVSKPGDSKILVVFSDKEIGNQASYGTTADGKLPLVFVIPVRIKKSDYCNTITFSVNGKEVEGVLFSEDTLVEINILNGAREKITSQYFHSGVLSPTVQFTNTTSQFLLPIYRNQTAETWMIPLNRTVLLMGGTETTVQQDWLLRVSFPNTYVGSCLAGESVFAVSLLGSVFNKPGLYFGGEVTPVISSEYPIRHKYSPCSRNVKIVFQEKSQFFGLVRYDKIKWFKVPDEEGKVLDAVLLPRGMILVTTRGIATTGENGTSVKHLYATHASVTATINCPAKYSDRVIVTLNQTTVLSAECPYLEWETLTITPDEDCKILDTYHDIIWYMTVVTQMCGDVVTINGSGYGHPFRTKSTAMTAVRGVHWDGMTSDMYVYGSHILHSSSRGRSLSTLFTLEQGDSVREMVSGGLSGDILAFSESSRVFISNVGINRFVEVVNIHTSPLTPTPSLTPTAYFTLDHTSQLCYQTLGNTAVSRYRIPRRALYRTESRSGSKLYFEPIGGNKVKLFSKSENDPFGGGDVGKIFRLRDERGAGRIDEVSHNNISGTTYNVATLEILEPFLIKSEKRLIVIDPHGDGSYTIGTVGAGHWTSRHVGSCIVVLHCTPFLVTGVHTASSLIASPLYPSRATECTGSVEPNGWFSINLAGEMSTVELDIGDKLEVVEVEGGQVTITTPSTLSQGLIGDIVTVQGDRQGVIHQVGEDNITLLSDAQFQLNEEFESQEISFSNIGSGVLTEGSYTRDSAWILTESECEVAFVTEDLSFLSHPVPDQSVHIDTSEEAELKVKVSDERKLSPSPPDLTILFSSRDKFHFHSTYNTSFHISQLTISLSHDSVEGGRYTPVLITPHRTASLRCEVPAFLFSVKQECDPQTRLVQRYPHIPQQAAFLSDTFLGPNGDNLITSLPINYRPPSIHGKEISTSPNVYNVHPDLPITKSVKAVSKDSYSFKQCAGAASRSDCGCSDESSVSDLAVNSDCRQYVYTVPYTTIFTPDLLVMRFGEQPRPLNHSYLITEVNGREEFQVYRASENTLSPNCNHINCSIVFLGSELFHFRVTVITDTICHYETEFMLFVVDIPLSKTLHNTITVHVGAIMFAIILIYYMSTKRTDTEREVRQKESKFKDNKSSSSSLAKTTPL